jgi:hypothetical protein
MQLSADRFGRGVAEADGRQKRGGGKSRRIGRDAIFS